MAGLRFETGSISSYIPANDPCGAGGYKKSDPVTTTIVILALIAAFLGLRLYSVLGKHGRDQEPMLPRSEERPRTAPASAPTAPQADLPRAPAPAPAVGTVYEPAAEIGIRAILSADRNFDVGRFVNGAKAAYRMILEAYWKGDRETLQGLCDADSYAAFDAAIAEREARGETLDNRLVTIDKAIITSASLANGVARLTVRFDADIAAITRDSDARIVAGSMTDAVPTQDSWSFVRDISSRDPNWLLDETDAD